MKAKSIRSATKQAVYERNYRRARDRALVRLSKMYPEDYRQLFTEEKGKDEAEGKTWIDIDLGSGEPVRRGSAHRNPTATNTRAKQETGGNL